MQSILSAAHTPDQMAWAKNAIDTLNESGLIAALTALPAVEQAVKVMALCIVADQCINDWLLGRGSVAHSISMKSAERYASYGQRMFGLSEKQLAVVVRAALVAKETAPAAPVQPGAAVDAADRDAPASAYTVIVRGKIQNAAATAVQMGGKKVRDGHYWIYEVPVFGDYDAAQEAALKLEGEWEAYMMRDETFSEDRGVWTEIVNLRVRDAARQRDAALLRLGVPATRLRLLLAEVNAYGSVDAYADAEPRAFSSKARQAEVAAIFAAYDTAVQAYSHRDELFKY